MFYTDVYQEYGVLDVTACRERLETPMFISAGLVPNATAFGRKGVPDKANRFTNEVAASVLESRVRSVWDKVVSLIGHFDLDPNRVAGIILDMLSTHLLTHHSFFLALLVLAMGSKRAIFQRKSTATNLIREGFNSLEEVYPHLSLPDEEMETVRTEYLANISGRILGAGMSLLAMAAPLESGPSHSHHKASAPADDKKPEKKETKSNKIVGLLSALLAVGALRPAFSILTRFPWLVDPHPEIADLLLQMLRHSISVLYEAPSNFFSEDIGFTRARAR
ncbi:hypothetical protein DFP72DRAFT_1152909 [Ephemerocybe angulata]|uniref:THO complex subunit 2 N-terminal domain-containing protein n=1 Tax=Ephemerocybe angulata TaxID=980116 RepID=A0A8H6HFI1_9AGAR|nr:hypothetical protein DFP72DRAFT_1152909 [Tulosesus angulatus]